MRSSPLATPSTLQDPRSSRSEPWLILDEPPAPVEPPPLPDNSTAVGLAAALQASAVMPNFLIYEYFVHNQEICDDISVKPLVPSGSYMELPTDPGIGIELDESKFAKYSGMQYPKRNLRTLEDERNWH